jgi:AhpD family alkylhydroperoxidase
MGLRHVPDDEMSDAFRTKVQKVRSMVGDARFLEVAANAPHMIDFYWGHFYEGVFFGGIVDIRVKELVRLLLANIHGCMFCQAGDAASARSHGVTDEEIDALWDFESGPFSPAEKAALRVAAGVSLANRDDEIAPKVRDELSDHFEDDEVIELLMVCGVLTGMARMMFAMDLADKSDACPVLPAVR